MAQCFLGSNPAIEKYPSPLNSIVSNSASPVQSAAIYAALLKKQDLFVDVSTTLTFSSLDNAGTQLDAILDSTNFAVRYIIGSGFLHDDIYFAMIFRKETSAVAKLFNYSYPGNDVYFYRLTWNGVATWFGPYWTNPPYVSGEAYLLAESDIKYYNVYGMYLEIPIDAAVDGSKTIYLNNALGGRPISKVVDFSYHVDNYLSEFNSVNENIEIRYGSNIVISYTTTKSHTIYLKLKFIKGMPT